MFVIILVILGITGVVILLEKSASGDVTIQPSISSPVVPTICSGGGNSIPQADGNSIDLPCGYQINDMPNQVQVINRLSSTDITVIALNAGFDDSNVIQAVAIALAESSGNPNAVGDKALAPRNGPSLGLWQINVGDKAHPELKNTNLFDPQTNANEAYKIYKRRGSFADWSTFINETYLAHLDDAQRGYDSVNA